MSLSPRLQKLRDYLQACGFIGATTLEIQDNLTTCAVGSDCADLRKHFRKHGIANDVKCKYEGMSRNNRRIFRYTLEVPV